MIYLDNAATTAIDSAVLDAMMPFLTSSYGNAGSLHSMGRTAYDAVYNARKQVAKFINASPEQIIFTSSGTEANNMVIHNAKLFGQKCIVTTATEHDSIVKFLGLIVLPVTSQGIVDLDSLIEQISVNAHNISLLSVIHTNNELGIENPIQMIGSLCYANHVPFHTDCVQAAGFAELDVKKFKCDFLTLSSHKIHGPKGVGALFVKEPDKFFPLIHGGESQEYGLRGGTENVAGIVGFGKACELAKENARENDQRIFRNFYTFMGSLEHSLYEKNLKDIIHYNSPVYASKILNVRFDGVSAESLLMMLDAKGVCASAGSACNASDGEPSHVLKAIGLTDDEARSSIRVSFSKDNTVEECYKAGEIVAECVSLLC